MAAALTALNITICHCLKMVCWGFCYCGFPLLPSASVTAVVLLDVYCISLIRLVMARDTPVHAKSQTVFRGEGSRSTVVDARLQVNRLNNWSCNLDMIHTKIYLIKTMAQYSLTLQYCSLTQHSFVHSFLPLDQYTTCCILDMYPIRVFANLDWSFIMLKGTWCRKS